MRRVARAVRNLVVVAFLLAVGLKIGLVVLERGCDTDLCCSDCDAIPVTRIIDGDTFVSGVARVRLYGVNAPEVGERCSVEATQRLGELARDGVRVERGPRLEDPYGRLLLYVYTKDGESIDEVLVGEGLAWAWTRDGQHRDLLVDAEARARDRGAGCLW